MPLARRPETRRAWPMCAAALLLFVQCAMVQRVHAQTAAPVSAASLACPAVLQHRFNRLQDGVPQDLCQFAGKVLLVVNTASYCGFTNQYEGLERLNGQLGARGLVVLGFPSNDFGQQEPGNAKQIADFCFNTYAVRFPMFAKSSVVGKDANPLFLALARASGKAPGWNFHKYVVDRRGRVVGGFAGEVQPEAPALLALLNKALAEK